MVFFFLLQVSRRKESSRNMVFFFFYRFQEEKKVLELFYVLYENRNKDTWCYCIFTLLCNELYLLTLKVPITTAADIILIYLLIVFRRKLDIISCESSARQRIHLKHHASFSSTDKSKKKQKKKSVACCSFA